MEVLGHIGGKAIDAPGEVAIADLRRDSLAGRGPQLDRELLRMIEPAAGIVTLLALRRRILAALPP